VDPQILAEIKDYLSKNEIRFQEELLEEYSTDASFLTRGVPPLAIFLATEEQAVRVVDFLAPRSIPAAIRAMGSSTAGSALADEESVLLLVEGLGVCDPWGNRTIFVPPVLTTADGIPIPPAQLDGYRRNPNLLREAEIYARVPAGLSTDELTRLLRPYHLQPAVVPSSGWSAIAANFSTNAGGNGSPTYGTFKDIVTRIRIVGTDIPPRAKVVTVRDRQKISSMAGHQGLLGIITELDVRVVFRVPDEELLSAVITCESKDISLLGAEVGAFMDEAQKNCQMINAEFMVIDSLIAESSDPLSSDPELGQFFSLDPDHWKMLVLYQGQRSLMQRLPQIAASYPGIQYREISASGLKKMLEVRKAAAGKATGRVGIPGFEDIFVRDPKKLGKVLAKIFEISMGDLPGRPYGHQYVNGLVIHYRPLAALDASEIERAWALTRRLNQEVLGSSEYAAEKRVEHGLGLELFALSPPERIEELVRLKKEFDPAMIFSTFLMDPQPKADFVGRQLQGLQTGR